MVTFKYQVLDNKEVELEKGTAGLIELERILPIELLTVVSVFGNNSFFKMVLEYGDMKYSVIKIKSK